MAPYKAAEDDVSIAATDNEDSEDIVSDVGEDHNSLRPGRKSLGLARDYVPDWTSRDAFREFCQNWFVTPFMTDRFTIADIVLQSGLTLLPKHSMSSQSTFPSKLKTRKMNTLQGFAIRIAMMAGVRPSLEGCWDTFDIRSRKAPWS
jgi:hypothetical protein